MAGGSYNRGLKFLLPVVLLSFFIATIHSIAEKNLEKERVYLAYKSQTQPIAVGRKNGNSRKEPGRRKWRRKEITVLTGLLSVSFHKPGLPTHVWHYPQ